MNTTTSTRNSTPSSSDEMDERAKAILSELQSLVLPANEITGADDPSQARLLASWHLFLNIAIAGLLISSVLIIFFAWEVFHNALV